MENRANKDNAKQFKQILAAKNIIVDKDFFRRYFDKKIRALVMLPDAYRIVSESAHNANRTVSREDFQKDIQFLKKILPNCYGGYQVHKQRGLNWNNLFTRWSKAVASMPESISPSDAVRPFEEGMIKFIDNHLQFIFIKKHIKKTSVTLTGNHKPPGTFVSRNVFVFKEAVLKKAIVHIGPSNLLDTKKKNLGLSSDQHKEFIEAFSPANKLEKISTEFYCYLRIPTFSSDVATAINNIKVDRKRDFNGPLIVDIRSNKGFSNLKIIHLVNQLAKADPDKNDFLEYFQTRLKKNRYTDTLADNFDLFFLLHYKNNQDRLDLRKSIKENLAQANHKNLVKATKINNKRKVFVLINRFVSSDGEALLTYLKNFDNVVILGENTSGSCEFVEPGLALLPRTKIPLLIPRGVNLQKNTGFPGIDGYGLAPDIYLDSKSWTKKSILECIFMLDKKP